MTRYDKIMSEMTTEKMAKLLTATDCDDCLMSIDECNKIDRVEQIEQIDGCGCENVMLHWLSCEVSESSK